MENDLSQASSLTSSNTEDDLPEGICVICGRDAICNGLGLIKYDVPIDHPNFGKLFRCPNNPPAEDNKWQERLRKIGNLSAFADKTLYNFETNLSAHTPDEQRSLNLALNVTRSYSENPHGWILLEGTYGCGKTHLAAAIGNALLSEGAIVLFITVPDLLDHLRSAYGPSSEIGYDETFERIRNADVLILDDLGTENPSSWAQEKLFQLLNHRYTNHSATIITTNANLDELDGRIRSRLLDIDLVRHVIINAPDFRTASQNERKQLLSNLNMYQDMTFDTFDAHNYVTPEERENLSKVSKAAYSYAQNPDGWFLLMGSFGGGKTHLAASIAFYRQHEGDEVMFVTAPDLLDYLRTLYGGVGGFDKQFQAIRNIPLLVLDDLGTENATSWAKEKLFQILDYRYVAHLPTVITTAVEMEKHDSRLQSRLLDSRRCAVFGITTRSYARRTNKRNR